MAGICLLSVRAVAAAEKYDSTVAFTLSVGSDTLNPEKIRQLEEVRVHGFSPDRFMVGLKVQRIDSTLLSAYQFQTLADFLQYQSPVAFKSYGSGQLASIAFRGTSASHTAVLWNGININSPTVGQTDFSTIPLLGFDKMAIQYGSAASCVGTDAVGGSLLLHSEPDWKQHGLNFTAGIQYGSFDNYNGRVGLRFVRNTQKGIQLSGKTLLYGSRFNNHFKETERSNGKQTYPMEPSETRQMGLVQDLYLKQKNGDYLSFHLWLTDNNLTIQPDVIQFLERTQTSASRFLLNYQWGNTNFKTAFVRDIIDYGKADFLTPSHSQTDRYIARAEHELLFKKTFVPGQTNLKIGGEFVHYVALVDGYGMNAIEENRGDAFVLLRQTFSSRLTASINLRQALSSKYKVPFTPSFGFEYLVISKTDTKLKWSGNIARSYRLPTLNERYWAVLGNPEIRPENGFNKELGLNLEQNLSEKLSGNLGVNVYHNLIDDWTYWNPDKGYRVENLQQVLAKGAEFSLGIKYQHGHLSSGLTSQYAYNHTSQQRVYDAYAVDIVGKQLIYVPLHTLTNNAFVRWKNWFLNVQGLYYSERYITFDHSGRPFPPYFLLNALLSTSLKLGKVQGQVNVQANNLTDTVYPSVKKNAMPGGNFNIGLVLNF